MRFCTRGVRSCSDTKLQHDVTCAVLRQRRQNGALSAGVVDDRADGALGLRFGTWSALASDGVVGSSGVRELDVDLSLTCATVVNFFVSIQSLVFPLQLLGLPVIEKISVDRDQFC